jgi:uncharacterized BrkB/YihY/UPF0761 family membrane protein
VMLVVAWIYYAALIFYFGAELTRAYATTFGSMVAVPDQPADPKPKAKAAGA